MEQAGSPAPQPATAGERHAIGAPHDGWRALVYRVTFESETPAGRLFDKLLIWAILASVAVVVVDSIPGLHDRWYVAFDVAEWFFTILFTVEYLLRLACLKQPWRYARSFFGVIDLLAVLPTYLALILPGIHVLVDVRVLRLLRIFRIFKLTAYISEYHTLALALKASRRKVLVFLATVSLIIVVMGSLMYVVEGPEHGFTSIPTSIYWAITTMTTVGYGDITPETPIGRIITAIMMLLGWGTLAVPTGIVTSEIAIRQSRQEEAGRAASAALPLRECAACGEAVHTSTARHCHQCGARLPVLG
ncbi:MAG: ion transporter [Sphingomonadaceae bacterium]|nr:ion transporter [Sphingomonadaceae bacterium]